MGSIPGLERSLGGGNGNPPRYSCLENSKDRGAWRATERGVAKNQTQVSMLCTHCVYFNATLPTGPALSFSFCVQKSSLYMFLSIPALKIG